MSDCPTCRTFAKENESMSHEIADLQRKVLQGVRTEGALKRELSKLRREDPLSEDIDLILQVWLELCVTPRGRAQTCIDLDSSRADIVRAALKRHTTGDRDERRQMCLDAVQGLALRPFVVNAQRKAAGSEAQRYCGIEHALGGEKKAAQRIEEHAAYFRRIQGRDSAWLEEVAQQAFQVWCAWSGAEAAARLRENALRCREPESGRPQLELVVDNAA